MRASDRTFIMDTDSAFPPLIITQKVWHVSPVEHAVLIFHWHWKGVEAPLMHGI